MDIYGLGDATRRAGKRQKDRLDLTRPCEFDSRITPHIPPGLVPEVDELRDKPSAKGWAAKGKSLGAPGGQTTRFLMSFSCAASGLTA